MELVRKKRKRKKKNDCGTISCDQSRGLNERDNEKFKFDLLVDRLIPADDSFTRIHDITTSLFFFLGTDE